ncbi:MAG: transglutaminase domain-containing protein [Eggerthellaceae bacterium]
MEAGRVSLAAIVVSLFALIACAGFVPGIVGQADAAESVSQTLTARVPSASATSMKISWKKYDGATRYAVYRSGNKSGKYKRLKVLSASARSYTAKKLNMKKNYYFYVKAFIGNRAVKSNILKKKKVIGNYRFGTVYGSWLSAKQLRTVRNKVAKFVNRNQTDSLGSFKKVQLAHDYLCRHTSYCAWNKHYADTALGPLKYHKGACSGYSAAFKAMCDAMGVPCRYVHATKSSANPYHQWNFVKVKGKWYLIDVQCDDSSGFDARFLRGSKSVASIKYIVNGKVKRLYTWKKKGMPKLAVKDYSTEWRIYNW